MEALLGRATQGDSTGCQFPVAGVGVTSPNIRSTFDIGGILILILIGVQSTYDNIPCLLDALDYHACRYARVHATVPKRDESR